MLTVTPGIEIVSLDVLPYIDQSEPETSINTDFFIRSNLSEVELNACDKAEDDFFAVTFDLKNRSSFHYTLNFSVSGGFNFFYGHGK